MALLNLIQTEFLKLRRKKMIWVMLLVALIMPFFAYLYFSYLGQTNVDPMAFYKWSAFGITLFILLPFVLGTLCITLIHDENQYDMLKQLWIIPVSKMGYFFSKFVVVLLYSIVFMLITAVASVLSSTLSGIVALDLQSILFLFQMCLVIAVLSALAILPIMAIAVTQKGYALPVCMTLVYIFLGFFITTINMYLHPISSISAVIASSGKIPGLAFTQEINAFWMMLCIFCWDAFSVLLAYFSLSRRK